jgi:hypothetical protein
VFAIGALYLRDKQGIMPEKKGKKPTANGQHDTPDKPAAVYFKSLTIRDVKCFRGEHTIDLSDGEGRPAQWTVILGNNNTGKTTLLKCLADLESMEFPSSGESLTSPIHYVPHGMFRKVFIGLNEIGLSTLYIKEKSSDSLVEGTYSKYEKPWGIYNNGEISFIDKEWISSLIIEPYGASRKMSNSNLSDILGRHSSLFLNNDIFNVEDWLLQAYLAKLQGDEKTKEKATKIIVKAIEVLCDGLLPDVKNIWFKSEDKGQSFDNYLAFKTDYGQIRLRDLGYGYQTMLAWVLDLVRRMFERYPDSPNPIREPAIVLVDEIDLHLHPEWQRKIIAHLTKYFPNTQFIVTAHSPLVVQSAEKINLVLLEKEGDHVNIRQPKIPTYQGWSLEEILTDVMGLDDRTHSDVYLDLYDRFEKAVEAEDYEAAQAAYEGLVKIVHPSSHLPKLLRLRMSSLMPV